ncbi:hypothetical protein GF340_04805 [Candidatus Peregrinibacteria bacterium]|nr:hypothetical protein [Candidatus Peregrinibacteria bacterium]
MMRFVFAISMLILVVGCGGGPSEPEMWETWDQTQVDYNSEADVPSTSTLQAADGYRRQSLEATGEYAAWLTALVVMLGCTLAIIFLVAGIWAGPWEKAIEGALLCTIGGAVGLIMANHGYESFWTVALVAMIGPGLVLLVWGLISEEDHPVKLFIVFGPMAAYTAYALFNAVVWGWANAPFWTVVFFLSGLFLIGWIARAFFAGESNA